MKNQEKHLLIFDGTSFFTTDKSTYIKDVEEEIVGEFFDYDRAIECEELETERLNLANNGTQNMSSNEYQDAYYHLSQRIKKLKTNHK